MMDVRVKKILFTCVLVSLLSACTIKDNQIARKAAEETVTNCNDSLSECDTDPAGSFQIAGAVSARGIMQELASESGVNDYKNINSINQAFNQVKGSFSASGEALNFSSDMATAALEMSSQFCNIAVSREQAITDINSSSRILFKGVRLDNTSLNAQGVAALSDLVIDNLAKRFWQRLPDSFEKSRIKSLITQLNLPVTQQGNRDLASTLCTLIGGSLQGFLSI